MANLREVVFTNAGGSSQQAELVTGSPSGREQLSVFGALGGATIHVQKQLVLRDGTTSSITDIETYTDEVDLEISIGKNNNLFVEVSGMTSTTNLIAKAAVLN